MKTKYHVERGRDDGKWFRDFEPSDSLEQARARVADFKSKEGKKHVTRAGMISVESGVIEQSDYRIVKVTREIIQEFRHGILL